MEFHMEIVNSGQNSYVLAVYALSNYVLLTRTVYYLLPVLFLTKWTTLLIITYNNRHFKHIYAVLKDKEWH